MSDSSPALSSLTAGRALDLEIERSVFGCDVSPWSLHLVQSEADLEGKRWRHGVFSRGGFPAEVIVADEMGDMPCIMVCEPGSDEWRGPRPLSTSIEAAWQVVEKMRAEGYELTCHSDWPESGRWSVRFSHADYSMRPVRADIAPLGICLAALVIKDALDVR